jgi:hypothetical protein
MGAYLGMLVHLFATRNTIFMSKGPDQVFNSLIQPQ